MDWKMSVFVVLNYLGRLKDNTKFVELVKFSFKVEDDLPPIRPQFFAVKKE